MEKLDSKGIAILVLIGIIFVLLFSSGNPKNTGPEWSGAAHVDGR